MSVSPIARFESYQIVLGNADYAEHADARRLFISDIATESPVRTGQTSPRFQPGVLRSISFLKSCKDETRNTEHSCHALTGLKTYH